MKKVGLVTYYGDNYGGILQAYALQTVVKKQGLECEIISNDFLKKERRSHTFAKKMKASLQLLRNPKVYLSKRRSYRAHSTEVAFRAKRFENFRNLYLDIFHTGYTTYEQYAEIADKYDIYLCGSDQIWNPNLYSQNGFYFAEFGAKVALKVAYASSIGLSQVNTKQAEFMKPMLEQLDIISTREQKGAEIIKSISNKSARVVLDPTLLLNADEWLRLSAPPLFEKPYLLCYLFGERAYVDDVKRRVKELTGLQVVTMPFVARELDSDDVKLFDVGPSEFISLIRNASLVLTDSFHATAFSVNLRTPFISLCRFDKNDKKSMNDRLVTFLNTVGLQDRLLDADSPIAADYLYDVDFEGAHMLLEEKRYADTRFLIEALNHDKARGLYGNL